MKKCAPDCGWILKLLPGDFYRLPVARSVYQRSATLPLFKRPAEILVGSSLIFLVGFRREKEFLMWPSYYPCVLGVQLDIVGYSWIMFRNHVRIVSILDGLEPRHQAAKLPGLQSLRAWSGCTGCIAPRNHQDTLWRYVTISRTCVFELFDTKMIRLNHNKLNACSRLGTRW